MVQDRKLAIIRHITLNVIYLYILDYNFQTNGPMKMKVIFSKTTDFEDHFEYNIFMIGQFSFFHKKLTLAWNDPVV